MINRYLTWQLSALATTLLILLPLLAIGYHAFEGEMENLVHLWDTMLGTYLLNSSLLVLGTVVLALFFCITVRLDCCKLSILWAKNASMVALLAVSNACLFNRLSLYRFARLFWGISGNVAWYFRLANTARLLVSENPHPLRCLLCTCPCTLPLYFLTGSSGIIRTIRKPHSQCQNVRFMPADIFRKITFPLIRPAIAVGMALVAMETLGDFGTVSYFAVPTLTTAIYDSWLGFQDLGTASRISIFMLLMIFLFISLEQYSRRKQKSYQRGYEKKTSFKQLTGWKLWLAQGWCWGLLALAFFIPFGRLIYWSFHYFEQSWNLDFVQFALNSLKVSIIASIITVALALLLHFAHRLSVNRRFWA